MINQFKNPTFGGFKPNAMQRIAGTLGYTGDMSGFQEYLNQNPDKQAQMDQFKQAAMTMARGGAVRKYQEGGYSPNQYSANPATTPAEKQAAAIAQQMAANTNDDGPAQQTQPVQTDKPLETPEYVPYGGPPTSTQQPTYTTQQTDTGFQVLDQTGKVIKTNLDDYQQAQDYAQQQGAQIGTGQFDTMPISDLGDYDPSQGMPEPLGQDVINQYTTDVPAHFNTELKEMFTSGKLPADPTDYTISGSKRNWTITYGDGTIIKNRAKNKSSVENDAANIIPNYINTFKESKEYTQKKAQQNAYRNYLTESTTGGVTGDIENIEQEYNTAQSNYTQLQLELERLSAQAAANPDDPYLAELVEAKGKEFSDAAARVQQLTPLYQSTQRTIEDEFKDRATDPTLPEGARQQATLIGAPTEEELIKQTSGQVTGAGGVDTVAQAETYLAQNVEQPDTAKYEADVAADDVMAQTEALTAAQTNEDDPRAKVSAAQATASMVGDLNAAQGTATLFENEVQREIQDGELISGAAADATKAAKFTEQIDAATATPSEKATVQGQLVGLMEQFEGTTPPPWAAGAVRLANQQMAARGLSASSMAGQAIMQAAMEAALPIAQADASTIATFEQQNLSNRQQRAMLAAEQRAKFLGQEFDQAFQTRVLNASKVSDIANMNFTADQQIQLENARAVQTMNLENLSNRQAMVLAEASALANLDMGNLNNRQQASVQNAQNFLSMDLANLSNAQQTGIFKTQQNINAMLTDQAARNAQMQFNAQSENQANQFYDNLNSTINMHNSTQANAQARFNAGQVNEMNKFNAQMKNDREQFNAKNQLIIDQSNAQWRREIATQDTAAINRANELNAMATLDISNTAYNNMWQMYSDQMSWAVSSYESEAERLNALALETLRQEGSAAATKYAADAKASGAIGSAIVSILTAGKDSVLGSLLPF